MSRNAGRHADRNTFRAVYEKVRHPHRKYKGFLLCLIKVRSEIDDIFIQIRQTDFLSELRKSRLGITHGSSPVTLDGSEITVSVHKDLPFFKLLCHDDQSLVDGAVAVGVIFTHRISHDTGTFPVGPVITYPQFVHIIESTSLNRF